MTRTATLKTVCSAARNLARCRRGVAALEFALAGSTLLLFLGGAGDFGVAVVCRNRLADAVSVGMEYAVITGPAVSPTSIKNLVASSAGLTLTSNAAVIGSYCVQGNPSTLVATAATATCADGSTPGTYAVLTARYTVPLLMPLGTRTGGFNLTESSSVRLQ